MKVRVGSIYKYDPAPIDVYDGRTDLKPGELVRVINLHGCPPANTMGHCYVERAAKPGFVGMVCTGSLEKK